MILFPLLLQHQQCQILPPSGHCLKIKISQQCETLGVAVDDSDLRATSALPDCTDIMQQYPKDSFPRIFWQQQMEAASRKNARTMRWHPLMIRWCLSLRHR